MAEVFQIATASHNSRTEATSQVNTIGPLILFQTTYSLLKESKAPKFVTISSGMGSITFAGQTDVLTIPYGTSKAAVNWVTRKLHHDFPDFGEYLLTFLLSVSTTSHILSNFPSRQSYSPSARVPSPPTGRARCSKTLLQQRSSSRPSLPSLPKRAPVPPSSKSTSRPGRRTAGSLSIIAGWGSGGGRGCACAMVSDDKHAA